MDSNVIHSLVSACKINYFNSYDSWVIHAMEEEKDGRTGCWIGCKDGREGKEWSYEVLSYASLSIDIYVCMYVCMCVYKYMYVYLTAYNAFLCISGR